MQKVGIPMMTGSDMGGNPLCFAGWGIHDELRLLVKAGLTPAEALIAATKNPAEFMGAGDRLGTIERASSPTSCCSAPIRSPTSPTLARSRRSC